MKTTIIIPTYNRPLMVERLLINMSQCSFPPEVDIYIVDGSRSGTQAVCEANTVGNRVRYLYSENAGQAKAINLALRTSIADFFIFFDDDITVPANMIETYVAAAQRYGPGHFFGGPLVADAEVPCPPHLAPHLPPSAKGLSLADHETEIRPSEFSFFFGANWAVFRSDLLSSGFFLENLGEAQSKITPVGDETELQHRLINASVRAIYLPSAVIHHFVGRECYTEKWVWSRTFRHGLYDYQGSRGNGQQTATMFGVPLWLIRATMIVELKLFILRLRSFPIERVIDIKMKQAYYFGWLYGAWKGDTI
jgi:GT2 family glycosyltransferase